MNSSTQTEGAKHTPLPWKIGSSNEVMDFGGGEAFSEWLNIVGADGQTVCELPGHSQFARGSEANKRDDANAALIIGAVNSHDALRAACQLVIDEWHANTEHFLTRTEPPSVKAARAALTKAKA